MYPNSPSDANPQYELMHALSALYVGGKYSDLTVVCNYRQWACHRAILCSRSGFFDGACSHQFREASTGVIDLSEDDEEAVEQMIHYFYYLDYLNDEPHQQPAAMFRHRAYSDPRRKLPKKLDLSAIEDPLLAQAGRHRASTQQQYITPPPSPKSCRSSLDFSSDRCHSPTARPAGQSPPPSPDAAFDTDVSTEAGELAEVEDSTEAESHLILHTQVYALAEKYDVPGLRALARRKFETAMACYYDAPEFAAAIEEVYCCTRDDDRGLRDVVMQAFRTHPQLARTGDVYAVICNTPSLRRELFLLERGLPIS